MLPAPKSRLHLPLLASTLAASLCTPQSLQIPSASAELHPSKFHTTEFHTNNPTQQHAAWQHYGNRLDPENAPHTVVFVGNSLQNIAAPNIDAPDIAHTIQASLNTWNQVPCSTAHLTFGGVRAHLNAVAEHEIPIFIPAPDYWNEHPNLIASANMTRPAIALNTAHFTWSLDPAPFQSLSPDHTNNPLIVDLQSVLTHELGHILGLWHTTDDATATMTAQYLPDATQRFLAADDKFALCHLYPHKTTTPAECTRNTDCPHGPCTSDQTFQVCQKAQANPGDFCALDLLHCPHGCIIDSPPTGTGYCTTPCQTHSDCPPHFACTSPDSTPKHCHPTRHEPHTANPNNPANSTSCATTTPHSPAHTPLLALLAIALLTRNKRHHKP